MLLSNSIYVISPTNFYSKYIVIIQSEMIITLAPGLLKLVGRNPTIRKRTRTSASER